jgi:hydrogenase nickel incorporation protein HypA/HybF
MHEAGLVGDLVTTTVAIAQRIGARRVTAVTLRVADPQHTTPDAIGFHFALAARGTLLSGARLVLDMAERCCALCDAPASPGEVGCAQCGWPLPPPAEPELALASLDWE